MVPALRRAGVVSLFPDPEAAQRIAALGFTAEEFAAGLREFARVGISGADIVAAAREHWIGGGAIARLTTQARDALRRVDE